MRANKRPLLILSLLGGLGLTGCHYGRETAGRPIAESEGKVGSTVATKEGTGDPKVGSGAGQVGTDAQPKEAAGPHTDIPAK